MYDNDNSEATVHTSHFKVRGVVRDKATVNKKAHIEALAADSEEAEQFLDQILTRDLTEILPMIRININSISGDQWYQEIMSNELTNDILCNIEGKTETEMEQIIKHSSAWMKSLEKETERIRKRLALALENKV